MNGEIMFARLIMEFNARSSLGLSGLGLHVVEINNTKELDENMK